MNCFRERDRERRERERERIYSSGDLEHVEMEVFHIERVMYDRENKVKAGFKKKSVLEKL